MKKIKLGTFYGGELCVEMPQHFDESKIDLNLEFKKEIESLKAIANLEGRIYILERQITIRL